jgi:hypothetical protein
MSQILSAKENNIIDKPVDFVKNYFAQLSEDQVSKLFLILIILYSYSKHSVKLQPNPTKTANLLPKTPSNHHHLVSPHFLKESLESKDPSI